MVGEEGKMDLVVVFFALPCINLVTVRRTPCTRPELEPLSPASFQKTSASRVGVIAVAVVGAAASLRLCTSCFFLLVCPFLAFWRTGFSKEVFAARRPQLVVMFPSVSEGSRVPRCCPDRGVYGGFSAPCALSSPPPGLDHPFAP